MTRRHSLMNEWKPVDDNTPRNCILLFTDGTFVFPAWHYTEFGKFNWACLEQDNPRHMEYDEEEDYVRVDRFDARGSVKYMWRHLDTPPVFKREDFL